jgi:hypothetical protein
MSNETSIPQPTLGYKEFFAELYRDPRESKRRVRLVGPVGERPLHACLLRAGALNTEMRAGLIDGVK